MSTTHRHAVETKLGRKLTPAEFGQLKKRVDSESGQDEWDLLASGRGDYEMNVKECALLVRSWEKEAQVDAVLPSAMPLGEVERLRAKAMVAAALATAEPDVPDEELRQGSAMSTRQWRRQYLCDGSVPLDGLGEWIRLQVSPLDKGSTFHLVFPGDDGHVARIPCRKGTLLGDLRYLCDDLAHRYGWALDAATAFVVCEVVSVHPWVRVTVPPAVTRFAERIVLDIDPDTPSEVVAAIYNEQRKAMGRPHRPKAPSTFAILSNWVSRADWQAWDFREWTRLPLREWDELRADMNEDARPLTRATARRGILRAWEYLTGEPFSR